jgi:UDP-N-acetylmuramoyl-L-alanyl-D-glutamate--2,6-diaminopimelate ligase
MKTLEELILNIEIDSVYGRTDVKIFDLTMDSRSVVSGSLFVALRGETVNGHNFINNSIEKGAVAVICEVLPEKLNKEVAYICVKDSSLALGKLASAFFDHPSEKLILTGVTGTNGKTTTATLLHQTFRNMGFASGLFSTVANYINEERINATHTTPDPVSLNRIMKSMVDQGCEYCFMEVSSHAVVQNRIAGLHFAGAIFTNLTHDHLDYHGDFKSYRDAKKKFFDELNTDAFALSNADDPNGTFMLQNTKAERFFYSLKKLSDFKGVVIENSMDGLQMRIGKHDVHFHLRGRFNAQNLLAIYGAAIKLGLDEMQLLQAMSALMHVDGRFHIIENTKGVYAIVDYAHTPDALENVLSTISELRTGNETLYVVAGAGGNRDKTKRPLMASVSAHYADRLILTSDNPRNEVAADILEDMKSGLDGMQLTKTLVIEDRREAIRTACMMSMSGDIILVAGKGHETFQEIQGVKYPFDDAKVLFEQLNG